MTAHDIRPSHPSQRAFTGERLREIAFPLGGIGTGTVSLGGNGQLRDWEIFNRPGKGKNLPYAFFALYAEAEGEPGIARVLERRLMPPFSGAAGLPTGRVSGLPRLREATFRGEYPFAWIDFEDENLPVKVSLEAYNPFIPMYTTASGMPCAWFHWTLTNTTDKPVQATVAFSLLNAVGYNGQDNLHNRGNAHFGQNRNEWREDDKCEHSFRGLFLSSEKYVPDSPQYGTMALVTTWPDTTYMARWQRAGWWDDVQNFWDTFRQGRGILPSAPDTDLSPDGQTDVGTLGLRVRLEPGQSATLPFLLTWHFPNLTNHWNGEEAVKGKRVGNFYGKWLTDAWETARYALDHRDDYEHGTRLYHETFWNSTLPAEALDAAGSNASILRSPTVLWTEDGRMNAFEGCSDNQGCCPMNCTHVWNYAQTAAYLFPILERTVRQTDFQHNTRLNGDMAFRTLLPLIDDTLWGFVPAADGQMGTVMKVYREWLQSGDRAFLESVWPGLVRAIEYAWRPGSWDADQDGVMEGEQHNTYDIEFYGPNTMMGTFYLGALRAAEELALVLGHTDKAAEYRQAFERGRAKYAEMLWNGEYYKQIVEVVESVRSRQPETNRMLPSAILPGEAEPRYQYGPGCLADQLLGQWFASIVGLGHLLPPEQVKSALKAIVRHNFKPDLSHHETVQRVYALDDEAGLLLCTWPNGGRPQYPFPYADEVWTGIEYQVAAHCLYEGLIDEGLAIVKGVRDRHDGLKRNPWDEFECGHHYARALSSWSLVLALSGYHYDAGRHYLEFAPKVNADNFRCFFSAGMGWGQFTQIRAEDRYTATLELRWSESGDLTLQTLRLPLPEEIGVNVTLDNKPVAAQRREGGQIVFDPPVTIHSEQVLTVRSSRGEATH